jgi:uncharacterized protein
MTEQSNETPITWRASTYIIRVHTHQDGTALLVHGYSKAVDLVSSELADRLEQTSAPITPSDVGGIDTFRTLIRRGYLTSKSHEAERDGFLALVAKIDGLRRAIRQPGFILMPTYLCNLDCFYCYQKPAIESDEELVKHVMSTELADRAFEAYERLLPSGQELKGGRILLYGGEPLLRSNRTLVQHVVARARAFDMSVHAITNGTQTASFEDLLGPQGISFLQVTLDGPKAMHDTRRVTRGKKGSFDAIVDNVSLALARDVTISLRINIDRTNLAGLVSLDRLFFERGWYDRRNFSAYAHETHMIEEQRPYMDAGKLISGVDISTFIANEGLRIRSSRDDALSHYTKVIGGRGIEGYKTGFCGANYGMVVFDPKGNVYSCWDEVEMFEPVGEFSTGQVVFNEHLRRAWNRSPIIANPRCHECAYAFFCGGGCDWHGKNEGDAYYDQYCPSFMADFRTAVASDFAIAAAAAARGLPTDDNGKQALTKEERAQILHEIGDKLKERNNSTCVSGCSSQVIKDEAAIHQKRTGLVRLTARKTPADGAPA